MSRKSPSQLKILNDTLDLMTLMTHMVCAFRTDGLTEADMKQVARFKQVVLEYMKMQKMLSE